jgi:MFS family permease
VEASQFYGALLLLGGIAGVLLGGRLGDRLGRRDRAFYAWVPAAAYLASVPLFALGLTSGSAIAAFALFLVPQALSFVWFGPVNSAVQHLVAPHARSIAAALSLLLINLIGLGGGIYALGAVSDALAATYGEDALLYSMLYSLALYALAGLLMTLAGRFLRRDWVAE